MRRIDQNRLDKEGIHFYQDLKQGWDKKIFVKKMFPIEQRDKKLFGRNITKLISYVMNMSEE